jgi:TonB family protein
MVRLFTVVLATAILSLTWKSASAQASIEILCDIDFRRTTSGTGKPDLVTRRSFTQTFTVNLGSQITVATRYALDDDSNPVQERRVHRTVPLATTHALVLCEREDFACDRDKALPLGRGVLTTYDTMTIIDLKQGTYTRRGRSSLQVDWDRLESHEVWSGTCRTRSGEPLPLPPVTRRADWFWRPFPQQLDRFFPDTAMRQEVGGTATVSCTAEVDGKLTGCQMVSESPEGFGFGEATVRASRLYRFIPAVMNGEFVSSQVRLPIRWSLPS